MFIWSVFKGALINIFIASAECWRGEGLKLYFYPLHLTFPHRRIGMRLRPFQNYCRGQLNLPLRPRLDSDASTAKFESCRPVPHGPFRLLTDSRRQKTRRRFSFFNILRMEKVHKLAYGRRRCRPVQGLRKGGFSGLAFGSRIPGGVSVSQILELGRLIFFYTFCERLRPVGRWGSTNHPLRPRLSVLVLYGASIPLPTWSSAFFYEPSINAGAAPYM